MSFDGIFTHLMVDELNQQLSGGRISKIHQPYENEIILTIRSQGKNHKLLISAHPSYARIQLTQTPYVNPDTPPNFIMMLRKYLDGAILDFLEQIDNDRVVHFHIKKRDELGDMQEIILIVELMGRHSTICLVNKQTGKILDAIKHIGSSQNSYRQLLPGVEYVHPPKQTAANPFTIDKVRLFELLSQTNELNTKYLQQNFQGLGKDTASELLYRLQQHPNDKIQVWQTFFQELKQVQPTLTRINQKEFFSPIIFTYQTNKAEEIQEFETLSELLEAFYHDKAQRDRVRQQGNELIKKVENELSRNQTKLKKREQTLAESENAEILRQKGELLTTFMSQVPKGAEKVTLDNYYENNQPLTIALNPALSANQNAQKYFQRYQKLRNAVKLIHEQIDEAKAEIAYLESVLAQLELAEPTELQGIREELVSQGYLKNKQIKGSKKTTPSKPDSYQTSSGIEILVGKNNLQNDQLTLKQAKKTDYWFHTKDIPGSHVILKTDQPSDQDILEASELAAFFSKYRYSAQVPVDCVQVKYIKKPNGAKPGFVIYTNQTTNFVTPKADVIERLRKH